ncbi:MAG: hypothetical protein FWE78_02465 [Methanimicrococcus sp.]|nr:hypothetical protein [Methanimicrococcus sp.]
MKKTSLLVCFLLVLGVVLVAGCLGNDNNSTNDTTVTAPPDPIEAPTDAAMYRGNVTNISVANDTTIITLEQVRGTNFGAAAMKFAFTDASRANIDIGSLTVGRYVEVYYGVPLGGSAPDPADIIVANLLYDANFIVYNGEIISATNSATTGFVGNLEVKLENNTTMIFNCNDDTQFYINISDLTAGTQVNILGNYVVQTSEPPQNTAFEIRSFAE